MSRHYTTLYYTTLHYITLRYITLHCITLYTAHITQNTLHIAHYMLHIKHYTLHITHCTLHITHYTLQHGTVQYITLHCIPLHYIRLRCVALHGVASILGQTSAATTWVAIYAQQIRHDVMESCAVTIPKKSRYITRKNHQPLGAQFAPAAFAHMLPSLSTYQSDSERLAQRMVCRGLQQLTFLCIMLQEPA